jgi:hypothetical protein
MAVEVLKAKIKVCMFEQHGTLVDVQKGLTAGFCYLFFFVSALKRRTNKNNQSLK